MVCSVRGLGQSFSFGDICITHVHTLSMVAYCSCFHSPLCFTQKSLNSIQIPVYSYF